jgi:hypothetical protein
MPPHPDPLPRVEREKKKILSHEGRGRKKKALLHMHRGIKKNFLFTSGEKVKERPLHKG